MTRHASSPSIVHPSKTFASAGIGAVATGWPVGSAEQPANAAITKTSAINQVRGRQFRIASFIKKYSTQNVLGCRNQSNPKKTPGRTGTAANKADCAGSKNRRHSSCARYFLRLRRDAQGTPPAANSLRLVKSAGPDSFVGTASQIASIWSRKGNFPRAPSIKYPFLKGEFPGQKKGCNGCQILVK